MKQFAYAYIKYKDGYKLISGYFDNASSWMSEMTNNPKFYLGGGVSDNHEWAIVFPDNYNGDELLDFEVMKQKCIDWFSLNKT